MPAEPLAPGDEAAAAARIALSQTCVETRRPIFNNVKAHLDTRSDFVTPHEPHGGRPGEANDSLVEVLWRRRKTVASCVAIGLAVGAAYVALAPKTYTAVARLDVERRTPNVLSGVAGPEDADNTSFLYMQKETVESTPVLALALADKRIDEIGAIAGTPSKLSTIRDLVSVDVGRKDGLLNVTASSKVPDQAKLLTSIIVDAYVEYHSEGRTSKARAVLAGLEAERAKAREELATKTRESEKFQQAAGVLPAYTQWSQDAAMRLSEQSAELAKCRVDIAILAKTIAGIPAPAAGDVIGERTSILARWGMRDAAPTAEDQAAANNQLMKARSRLASLNASYPANHPAVQAAVAGVQQLGEEYFALLERRLAVAQMREETLANSIKTSRDALVAAGVKADEYRRLTADVGRIQTLIDTLDSRIREYAITGDANAPSIRVLEPAHVDERETSPRAGRTLGLAALLGLAVGSLGAFARERSQVQIRRPIDAAMATGLPVLGTLGAGGAKFDAVNGLIAERQSDKGLAVAITSASANDGRTEAAVELADSLARDGRRVLLLNADPASRNAEHRAFPRGEGLSEAIFNERPLTVSSPEDVGLLALGFGDADGDLASCSNAFEDALNDLRNRFDAIVIDCAPDDGDAAGRMVPALSDLTVHVVPAGTASRAAIRHVLDRLAIVGVEPAGVVLTSLPPDRRFARLPRRLAGLFSKNSDVTAMQWPRKRDVFGVGVSETTYEECEQVILAAARKRESAVVTHLAVHPLITAATDAKFRRCIQKTEIVAPDGQPVRWALNVFHGAKLKDRVYGPELMLRLCRQAARWGVGVYLYGGTDDVLAKLVKNLADEIPGFKPAGMESPPFRPLTAEESDAVCQRINDSGAGLVFIGLGCPKQDYFAFEHRDRIQAVQLCVGAAFDFHAGVKPMAPSWMQRLGLEWAFRLASEPKRLWKRYAVTNSLFVYFFARRLLAGR